MKDSYFSKYISEAFERIKYLEPRIQEVARELLCRWALAGHYFRMPEHSGKRTSEEQKMLYNKRPRVTWVLCPNSFHCLGFAMDFVPLQRLGSIWFKALWGSKKKYEDMSRIAMDLGFTWGMAVWGVDAGHIHWAAGLPQKDRVDDILNGQQPDIPDYIPVKKPEVMMRALRRLANDGKIPQDSIVLKS